jgi:hypothetical protein
MLLILGSSLEVIDAGSRVHHTTISLGQEAWACTSDAETGAVCVERDSRSGAAGAVGADSGAAVVGGAGDASLGSAGAALGAGATDGAAPEGVGAADRQAR